MCYLLSEHGLLVPQLFCPLVSVLMLPARTHLFSMLSLHQDFIVGAIVGVIDGIHVGAGIVGAGVAGADVLGGIVGGGDGKGFGVSVGVDLVGALVGVKDGKDIKIIVGSEDGKDVGAIVGADVIVKSVVGLCVGLIVFVLPSYTTNTPFLESEIRI